MLEVTMLWLSLSAGLVLARGACTVGPDYVRPPAATSAAFKEVPQGWKVAQPADAFTRGTWWEIYSDPVLDGLERQVEISNQNLKAFEAAFRQASAIIGEARAQYFPTVGTAAAVTRAPPGAGSLGTGGGTTFLGDPHTPHHLPPLLSNWQRDLRGRIRPLGEGDPAAAPATP